MLYLLSKEISFTFSPLERQNSEATRRPHTPRKAQGITIWILTLASSGPYRGKRCTDDTRSRSQTLRTRLWCEETCIPTPSDSGVGGGARQTAQYEVRGAVTEDVLPHLHTTLVRIKYIIPSFCFSFFGSEWCFCNTVPSRPIRYGSSNGALMQSTSLASG